MAEKIYFYPIWLRLWHVINAVFCILLIITGVSMQYAFANPIVSFEKAVSIHNFSGIALTINYTIFLLGNIFTPNGNYYRIKLKKMRKKLWKQLMYYSIGVFKNEKAPYPINAERKFNPLQQISYIVVMYMAIPILFITGWALLFPEFILKGLLGFSGIFLTAQFHVLMGFLVTIFLIVHLYVSTMGTKPISNFKSIVTGWQEAH
ncbi:MAG: cytochrome b/b6 domain-containing protein [Bacteroidales bacterium]|nr:cytochrome b/b6 domain-containing protein [Bacteroidales bacterium]